MMGSMRKRLTPQKEAEEEVGALFRASAQAQGRKLQRDMSLMSKMDQQDELLEQQEMDMRAAKEDRTYSMMDAAESSGEALRRRTQRNAGAYKRFINRMLMMRKASLVGEDMGDIEDPLEGLDEAMEARQSNRGGY
ncbi:hypothetical protein [Limnobacter sp.]|uniref:hypothetical protein n=1 Tax=Limnobacter sp. TaxID=2003368 RepID=UPI0025B89F95|nr:hypothetical protein [Limnobacter sp.]